MGYLGSALGIRLSRHDLELSKLLKLIAKEVIIRDGNGNEVCTRTPTSAEGYADLEKYAVESNKMTIKLHDDLSYDGKTEVTVEFDSDESMYELNSLEPYVTESPSIRIGRPTTCSAMIWVACCDLCKEESVDIDVFVKLRDFAERLTKEGRLDSWDGKVTLCSNCCS